MRCDDCGFSAKSPAGLATHRRWKHRGQPDGAANGQAIEVTLAELQRAGRLETIDAARVQALRTMAAALDLNPFNGQMWREYREGLEGLMSDGGDEGALEALLEQLSSPMGDAT